MIYADPTFLQAQMAQAAQQGVVSEFAKSDSAKPETPQTIGGDLASSQ